MFLLFVRPVTKFIINDQETSQQSVRERENERAEFDPERLVRPTNGYHWQTVVANIEAISYQLPLCPLLTLPLLLIETPQ